MMANMVQMNIQVRAGMTKYGCKCNYASMMPKNGQTLRTVCIVTTQLNKVMACGNAV